MNTKRLWVILSNNLSSKDLFHFLRWKKQVCRQPMMFSAFEEFSYFQLRCFIFVFSSIQSQERRFIPPTSCTWTFCIQHARDFFSCWEKRETRHISRTDCMSDSPCFCQFYCWMSVKHGDAEGKTSVSCEYFDNHIADFLLNGHFICGNKKERQEICGKKPETEYKNKSQSVTCNGAILESWSILEACIFSLKWFCPISMTGCF